MLSHLKKFGSWLFFSNRSDRLTRQSSALVTLARRKLIESSSFDQEVQVITELAANTIKVERVGVWLYEEGGSCLRSIDLYERSKRRHSIDRTIRSIEYPQYFRNLEQERAIAADDAHVDPRTSEYLHEYLLPKGIKSLLDAPIRAGGKIIGIICFESVGHKRKWTVDEQSFASSVADIAATTFETAERLKAREELQNRLEFEQLLLSITNRFINVSAQDVPNVINEALKTLGGYLGVDRCYVYTFNSDGLTMANTNEWVGPGVEKKISERQKIPLSSFPWAISQIKKGEIVSIDDTAELPQIAEVDKRNWQYFGVISFIGVPLFEEDRIVGLAGCSMARKPGRQWSLENTAVLRLVGETLSNMYARERALKEREDALEERRRMESRMLHAQKLESLGLLAGGIAHDFNNLLMGMLGNAGLLLLELPKDSKARDRLEQIKRTAERAAELTSQLLAYSGKGKLAVEPVDIGALAHEMVDLLGPVVSPRARVVLDLDKHLPLVEVDTTQIRQVIMNLITNSSDALGDKYGEIRIRTGVRNFSVSDLKKYQLGEELPEGAYVFIEVSDNGCGMCPETLRRIFDPFFTTKFTGRGLGLAAVHGIIRGHRGAIAVESTPNAGTTFRIMFPEYAKPIQAVTEGISAPNLSVTQLSGYALVIDDEEHSRIVVHEMLEQMGCRVTSTSSGANGIEIARRSADEINVILLDMTMPDMDGEATYHSLRQVLPDCPVILMSGYSESEAMNRFKGGKLAGFLQKPFGPAALREKVEEFTSLQQGPKLRLVK